MGSKEEMGLPPPLPPGSEQNPVVRYTRGARPPDDRGTFRGESTPGSESRNIGPPPSVDQHIRNLKNEIGILRDKIFTMDSQIQQLRDTDYKIRNEVVELKRMQSAGGR